MIDRLPDNLLSHRDSWIAALERLIELEPATSPPDADERGFWQHELNAMRVMYADLDRLVAQVPDEFICDSKPLERLLNATAMVLETPCQDSATYWAGCLADVEQLLAQQPAAVDERARAAINTALERWSLLASAFKHVQPEYERELALIADCRAALAGGAQ